MEHTIDAITSEELSKLQEAVSNVNRVHMHIGHLEAQKQMTFVDLDKAKEALLEVQGALIKEYGDVDIDLTSGHISNGSNS